MATIIEMVYNRLPDEAELFDMSLADFVEEAQALEGLEGIDEEDLSTLQKSLLADLVAKALILPAMSNYKKAMAKAKGDGSGEAEFVDKLEFLNKMEAKLIADIDEKRGKIDDSTDTGVPLIVNED